MHELISSESGCLDLLKSDQAHKEQSLKYARDVARIYMEEKARRRELEAAEERIRAVIDSMRDAMIATDSRFRILESNESFRRLFYAEPWISGRPGAAEIIGEDFAGAVESLDPAPESPETIEFLHKRSGKHYSATVTKLRDGMCVFIFHDVTMEKRVKSMRDEFLGILSHELRTPLNGIMGFAQLMLAENEKLDSEQFEYVRMIEASGRRMFKTVNELLSYADLVADAKFESKSEIDLCALVRGVIDELHSTAEEYGIGFELRGPGAGFCIFGFKNLLRELFRHIFWNCLLFGNRGGLVKVDVRQDGDKAAAVVIEDDGLGIPPDQQDRVFDPFYQVQDYLSRNREGLGLGLTLARRIARMHGGEVSLESDGSSGTTVTMQLGGRSSGKYNQD